MSKLVIRNKAGVVSTLEVAPEILSLLSDLTGKTILWTETVKANKEQLAAAKKGGGK